MSFKRFIRLGGKKIWWCTFNSFFSQIFLMRLFFRMFSEFQSVNSSSLLPMSYYQLVSPTPWSSCCIRIFLYPQCTNLPQSQEVYLPDSPSHLLFIWLLKLDTSTTNPSCPLLFSSSSRAWTSAGFSGANISPAGHQWMFGIQRDHRLSIFNINLLHRVCVCVCARTHVCT